MDKLRVCCLMNRTEDHYPELERSCIERDIPLYAYIRTGEFTWKGKILWEQEITNQYPDDYFVFIDGFDFLCTGDRKELEELVRWKPLLFSTDKDTGQGPWPIREMKDAFDLRRKAVSPWCYLNGSGPTGRGSNISNAIKWGLENFDFQDYQTDQTFWQFVYLAGMGELDQRCLLTHALWGVEEGELAWKNNRLYNLVTMSRPQFLHASGRTWRYIPKECLPKPREPRP